MGKGSESLMKAHNILPGGEDREEGGRDVSNDAGKNRRLREKKTAGNKTKIQLGDGKESSPRGRLLQDNTGTSLNFKKLSKTRDPIKRRGWWTAAGGRAFSQEKRQSRRDDSSGARRNSPRETESLIGENKRNGTPEPNRRLS